MLLPVLVQDQQQLLRPAQSEDWDQTGATATHDALHCTSEGLLATLPVIVYSISIIYAQYI